MGVGFAVDFLWIYGDFFFFFFFMGFGGFMEWMFGGFAVAVCSGFVEDFWWVCKGRSGVGMAWTRGGSQVWVAGWLLLLTNHYHNPYESHTKHEHEHEHEHELE
jgi:hypothetical protein